MFPIQYLVILKIVTYLYSKVYSTTNQEFKMTITYLLYDGITALDVVGSYEFLSRVPNTKIKFASQYKGLIKTDAGILTLFAEYSLDEITKTDVLIVPGATISFLEMVQSKQVLNWIKAIHEKTTYTVAISSGSVILGAAGLLAQRNVTSHWYAKRFLESYDVVLSNKRFVQDGKIITTEGVTASLDLGLFLSEKLSSPEMAQAIQLILEYEPKPHTTKGFRSEVSIEITEMAKRKIKDMAFKNSAESII